MTTIADLIKVLQTLPSDTQVKILAERFGDYTTDTRFEDIDLSNGIRSCDHLWFGNVNGKPQLHIGCK